MLDRPAGPTCGPFIATSLLVMLLILGLGLGFGPGAGVLAQGSGEDQSQSGECVPSETESCADEGSGGEPQLVRGDDGCWYDAVSGEVAYCEDEVDDTLVPGDDGCWYHPDGTFAYCEEVEETPPPDGGLIPGDDDCLYYPDGGLAECPSGEPPVDGGCTPKADGSEGCVVPGPVGGATEDPLEGVPPDDDEGPEAVLDESSGPAIAPPAQDGVLGGQVDVVEIDGAASAQSPFDPVAAAGRVRAALAPFGVWLAVLLRWLMGTG